MISAMILFLAAAAAQPQVNSTGETSAPKSQDPVVCERIKEIGSMLRSKKICMRRSEWAEQRRGDRMNIERSQTQQGINSN